MTDGILGEAGGDNAAGGAAARDHIVELAGVDHGADFAERRRRAVLGTSAACYASTSIGLRL